MDVKNYDFQQTTTFIITINFIIAFKSILINHFISFIFEVTNYI